MTFAEVIIIQRAVCTGRKDVYRLEVYRQRQIYTFVGPGALPARAYRFFPNCCLSLGDRLRDWQVGGVVS